MSQTVDSRVVEMRFDNKQFEAGAKQTMGTLGKLKEALKLPETGKALEGIDKATKSIKLDGIAAGVEALERRFSALGIVGMRVIENITDGLMNKLHAAVNFVTDSIISGGIKRAMNIESAHFQLQALLKDEVKVQAVMANAMESVDGTAYAYDEAAKAASQFAASGIQAGEDMLGALKGITGVAAMTNSSFEDVSRIFTTVAGNGRLMGDQLLQLSSRGLNAASTLADYFREVRGQSKMTEATIREMVSKGQISFKDFSDAMTWAFGDSAKRANETFTGAMSNMKSALARIGAGFVSPLVEQNGELVQLFNALRIKINDVKSALVFDEQRSAMSGLAEVTRISEKSLGKMFDKIKRDGKVSIIQLDNLKEHGANAEKALLKYINGVNDGSIRASYAIKNALGDLTKGTRISTAQVRKFVEEGKIDLATFTAAMETEFGTEKTLSKQFTDWFQDHVHKIVDAINQADVTKPMEIFYYWVESIKNVAKGIASVVSPIGKAFGETFSFINIDRITSLSKVVTNLTSKMRLSERGSKNLHDAFKGIFDIAVLLGDSFIGLFNAVLPISKPIGMMTSSFLELIGYLGRALSEFSVWVRSSESMSKAFDKIHSSVDKMSIALSNGIIHIKDFLKIVKDFPIVQNVISAVSKALEKLGDLGGKVEIRLIPFTKVMEFLLNIIQKSGPIVTTIINGLGKTLKFLMDSIGKALATGGFNSIYDLFKVAVLVGLGKQLSAFIENLNKTVKSAGGFIGSIKKIFSGVTDTFKNLQNTLKANVLKSIAISMALIAGSIFILSMIDSEKLAETLGTVSVLLGELTGIFLLLNKVDQNKKGSIRGLNSLIAMAVSITILAGALKKVSDIDSDKLLGSLGSISALLVEMTVIAIALSKYGGKVKTGVVGIIAFSAAIYILTSSVKKLGELDTNTLIKGLVSVGALLAELALFMMSSKIGSLKPTQAVGIVILSSALLILQKAVEGFGSLNTEILLTGLIAVGAVLTEIAAFSLVAGESKHILKTSVSLVIMAKAIEMLQKPMSDFGNMDWSQIGKSLVAIGGALAEITLAMRLMPKNALTVGVGLLAVAGSLTIIGKVVMDMSTMSWEEIGKGMVSLGGSLAILAVAMNAMKGTLGASAAMLVMTTSLAILTPVLKSLGAMSWIEIAKGLVVLASSFAVIGISAGLLSPIIPAILGLSGAIALLGVAALAVGAGIFALSIALTTLAASGVAGAAALVQVVKILMVGVLDTIADEASAIGRVLKTLILTACDVIITCVPEIVKTILVVVKEVLTALVDNAPKIVSQLLKLIIGIIDALAADLPTVIQSVMNLFSKFFAGIIQTLNGMDTDVLVQTIVGVGLLTGIMLAMAVLSNLAPSAMVGVLAFGAIVAELAIVLAAVGAIAQIPGLKWLINEGGELLEGVGTAIGKFIGGIVGGVLGGIASQLPQMGTDLSAFMVNLQPFIEGSKNIDAGALAAVGFLTAIIIALSVAEVINGLNDLFGLSLVNIAFELSDFIIALQPFIENTSQLSAENMKACRYLASMIIALTAAELLSGIGKFLGLSGGSIADFGKELSEFAPYIKQFAADVKDVKPEAVQGAASAAEIMATVASKLQGHGGIIQDIIGDKSLKTFAEELVAFGPAIADFAETVKDVKPEAVQGAASAAEIMATVAEKLPNQGGLAAKIFGDNTLSEFGEELVAFAPNIADFADTVKDIKPEAVQGAAAAATIMSNLADNLPSSDSLWDKIFGGGQIKLSEFGEELISFGTSMSDFSQSITNVNNDQITNAINNFKELANLSEYIKDSSAITIVEFSGMLKEIAIDSVDNFVNIFENSTPRVESALKKFLPQQIVITLGENSILWIIKGIRSQKDNLKNSAIDVSNAMIFSFRTTLSEDKFYEIGSNAAVGLKKGIESKINKIAEASVLAATKAIEAARKTLDIHSPSRVFFKMGEYVSTGLANGIIANSNLVNKAGNSISEKAMNGFMSTIKSILSLIDSEDFDVEPTITPVVDLSGVNSSFEEIASMFKNKTFDISAIRDKAMDVNYSFNHVRNRKETDQNSTQDKIGRLQKAIDVLASKERTNQQNTFYITSTDPKGAAEEVSRILQRQVERREAVWGK